MIRNNQVNGFYYTSNSHPTIEKIYAFQKLEKGWSYGEGIPFQESILDDAVSLIKEATKFAFYTTDAFPGLDGEIMCTVYYHEHYLEFIIESDCSVTFSCEKDGEEICYQEGLLLQNAKDKIKGFWQETWNTTSERRFLLSKRKNWNESILNSESGGGFGGPHPALPPTMEHKNYARNNSKNKRFSKTDIRFSRKADNRYNIGY